MDKTAFASLSYGVYVVCTGKDGLRNGQICNTVFQIAADPPTLGISVNKLNYTHECLAKTFNFSVSVLSEEAPMTYIGRFGFRCGRDFDKLAGLDVREGITGAPIVSDYAVAFVECRILESFDCGTHTLFLGEALDAGFLGPGTAMTYAYYHSVKKGKSPSRAPTFIGS
jgi:ferric-chelate reductase [NAD(P)H]